MIIQRALWLLSSTHSTEQHGLSWESGQTGNRWELRRRCVHWNVRMPDRVGFAPGDAMAADEATRQTIDGADSFTIANEQATRAGD
jgi:hypothetical protein